MKRRRKSQQSRQDRAKADFLGRLVETVVRPALDPPDTVLDFDFIPYRDEDEDAGDEYAPMPVQNRHLWQAGTVVLEIYGPAREIEGGARDGERQDTSYHVELASVYDALANEVTGRCRFKGIFAGSAPCPHIVVSGSFLGVWVVVEFHLHPPSEDASPTALIDAITGETRYT